MSEQEKENLHRLRHSVAHIMAQAVLEKFPEGQIAIGPPIENGFYYDFGLPRSLTPEDMQEIEARMREIIAGGHNFVYREVSEEEARRIFANQPYKLELVDGILSAGTDEYGQPLQEKPKLSIYQSDSFIDLCRGPHVANAREINPAAFKLLNIAGAYWRGDERRPMLQRIYGTAWNSKEELDSYLAQLAEIESRDHRKLIKELDLISFHEIVGAGLALWHPRGGRIRVLIEDYWRKLHYEGGYDIIFTPHIGQAQLWETSGHLRYYKENMYAPMDIDGQDYYLKPVNCPLQIQIYKSRLRSYRELPLRWAEIGTVYRYERSGALHGLLRVRAIAQDDAHIICTPKQIDDEILRVLDFSINLLQGFGFDKFKFELSVRDPNHLEKYAGSDEMWQQAEASLAKALQMRSLPYQRMEGEAVFYGPKIDIKIEDALKRTWQCTTIQFDFNMPVGFNMTYIDEDGKEHRPYMVHRALLGSLERFFGVLVEHYGGAFPVWLTPVQVVIVPIAQQNDEYVMQVLNQLKKAGVRAEADLSSDRMNAKIRNAQMQKVPYILVIGNREMEAQQVNLRLRDGTQPGTMSVDEFIAFVKQAVEEKRTL